MLKLRNMISMSMLLFIFSSCGKKDTKKYTCSYDYYYLPENIAFVGFSSEELSHIIFQQYKKGSNFSELIKSDTIDASNPVFVADTSYKEFTSNYCTGFFYVVDSSDYKISLLNGNKQYYLALKKGPLSETWEQASPCSPGSHSGRFIPYYISLNDQEYTPFAIRINQYFIYLRR